VLGEGLQVDTRPLEALQNLHELSFKDSPSIADAGTCLAAEKKKFRRKKQDARRRGATSFSYKQSGAISFMYRAGCVLGKACETSFSNKLELQAKCEASATSFIYRAGWV
jgi:hypothetical protein